MNKSNLHIIVCIKSVVRAAPKGIARRDLQNSELNPFDRPALEAALQLKESTGAMLTVLSMGPPVAGAALAEARALGADRAVLLSDPALAGSDTLVTARVLAAAASRLAPYDFILFGVRTADSDTGQVGPQTASLLGLPFVGGVRGLRPMDVPLEAPSDRPSGGQWEITRTMDEWEELWQVRCPAALTIDARAFLPRHVGLAGLASVYEAPEPETWNLDRLGLTAGQCGLEGSPTRVAALHPVKQSRKCRQLDGQPDEQVEALVDYLSSKGLMTS